MMNKRSRASALKLGQVWQLTDCRIEIGLVGRTLVHYRRVRGPVIRPPIHLTSQVELERELRRAAAVLLPDTPAHPPAGRLSFTKPRSRNINKPRRPASPDSASSVSSVSETSPQTES